MSYVQELVEKSVKKHGSERQYLLPILQNISKEMGYLTEEAMIAVAKGMDISSADVYGVATFYTFLDTKPRGKNVIRICRTISCHMNGKDEIIRSIENKLRIKLGETTPDNLFTFVHTNCIGQCHEGPAMLINDEIYTHLTPETAIAAIEKYM